MSEMWPILFVLMNSKFQNDTITAQNVYLFSFFTLPTLIIQLTKVTTNIWSIYSLEIKEAVCSYTTVSTFHSKKVKTQVTQLIATFLSTYTCDCIP